MIWWKIIHQSESKVPICSKVLYNPNVVKNTFSLSEIEKKHRITYVKQDRSMVEYGRGTNSMVLPDQRVTPMTARVVESLDTPTGSPVVVLESREPKAPKLVSKEVRSRE
jgi:hypothetical protein